MNHIFLLTIWLICYIGPALVGEWYDYHFSLYQAAISLFLILCALPFRGYWWIRSFSTICLLQILLNSYDYFAFIPSSSYNSIQAVLNGIEFVLLFVIGTMANLREYYDSDTSSANSGNYGRGSGPRS